MTTSNADRFVWAPANTRTLKRMHANGRVDAEIAERIGCKRSLVAKHRAKLGLPANRPVRTTVCPPEHSHANATTCYERHSCTCEPCTTRAARRRGARSRAIAYGTFEPGIVSAERARAHIAELQAALPSPVVPHALAKIAGVHDDTIGRADRIARVTEARILALTPEQVMADPFVRVSARGAVRRIHALQSRGWSMPQLAERTGISHQHLNALHEGRLIGATRWTRIAAVFDQLWDQAPPADTAPRRNAIARTLKIARRAGYLPPLAWDDIDRDEQPASTATEADEVIDPIAVDLAIAGHHVPLRTFERHEAVTALNAQGLNDNAIAERIGCAPETVQRDRAALDIPAAVDAAGRPIHREDAA